MIDEMIWLPLLRIIRNTPHTVSASMSANVQGAVISATLVLAMCLIVAGNASGWSNGGYSADPDNPDYGTHDWVANAALQSQTKDVTFLKTTYNSLFLLGTEAPDNPSYIGDTGSHHFYYHSDKSIQDDVCADRASSIYSSALQYLKSNDLDLAAFEIGVMAHYISDVGVFGHTMGASTDWGAEVHHSDYENGFESRLGSISTPSTSLGDLGAYDATAGLAYKITFGSGTIKSNTWMDTNYDWVDAVFEAGAMASLYASVTAVAAAINHLMIEAASSSSTSPTIAITSPASSSTFVTNSSTVNLGGTASDDIGVTRITWSNAATSVTGTASGTLNWTIAGILLSSGNNVIKVTAYDATNNSGIDIISVIYTQQGSLAVAGLATVSNGTKPLSVSFTCIPTGGVPPYTYSWTFGDGAVSNLQNPSHIYNSAGTFNASVTVTDSVYFTEQWTKTIAVMEPSGSGTAGIETISALVAIIAVISVIPLLILKRRKKMNR